MAAGHHRLYLVDKLFASPSGNCNTATDSKRANCVRFGFAFDLRAIRPCAPLKDVNLAELLKLAAIVHEKAPGGARAVECAGQILVVVVLDSHKISSLGLRTGCESGEVVR